MPSVYQFSVDELRREAERVAEAGVPAVILFGLPDSKDEIASGKMTEDDVKYLTAEEVNYHYGHLNYTLIGRNPTVQHIIRAATLAPDFMEANLKNFGLDAKGFYSKHGREATYGLLLTAAVLGAAAKIANAIIDPDGDPHFEKPFSIVHNGKVYSLRNEASDLANLIMTPWKYTMGRVSPLASSLIEAATGRNYRGEKVTDLEVVRDIATKAIPISMRAIPALSRLADPDKTTSAWENFMSSNGITVSRDSPINQVYPLIQKWKSKSGEPVDRGTYPQSPYLPIRYALEDGDKEKAKKEILRAADSKQNMQKLLNGFKESVFRNWTGSAAGDAKFKASLTTPVDKAILANGEAARKRVWQSFLEAWKEVAPELQAKYREKAASKAAQ